MIKETKLYITIIVIMILLVFSVAIMTRLSYKGSITLKQLQDNSDVNNYTVQFGEDTVEKDIFKTINNYDDLKTQSKFFAKIHVTDERKLFASAVYTKVIVKKTYKSDYSIKKNDHIYIYEPVSFEEDFRLYDSSSGYQLMRTNEDYYVFLNELPSSTSYIKSKKEKVSFIPSTLKYSIYCAKNTKTQLLDKNRMDSYKYVDIKNLDILNNDSGVLNKYKEIKKNIIDDLK